MTTEQKEAIEYLKEHINYFKEQIRFIEAVDCDYYDEEYELYKNRVKQFETVLNLIQEQEKEVEAARSIITEMNNDVKKLIDEVKKKDKEIKQLKENIDYQILCDFLISSVSGNEEPIWTEKHIKELLENFDVRWKNAYK